MAIIHREGYRILPVSAVLITVVILVGFGWHPIAGWLLLASGLGLFAFMVQFFRNPKRNVAKADPNLIYSPADGKVVVIEITEESEVLQTACTQISIFMSTWNVHANRIPISGEVTYIQHHPGKYLVAWHPKSSTQNERCTTAIRHAKGTLVMRQIAGAVARRIRNYLQVQQQVVQGAEMGFIRFGSRVDIFLPTDAEILVKPGQAVKAAVDVLARLR